MEQKNKYSEFVRSAFWLKHKVNEEVGKEFGLPATEVEILAFLYLNEGVSTATDIWRGRNLKKNTISIHIDNLVKRGYLERAGVDGDRRRVSLTLTDNAKRIAEESMRRIEGLWRELLEGIDAEQLKTFEYCIGIINSNAKRLCK